MQKRTLLENRSPPPEPSCLGSPREGGPTSPGGGGSGPPVLPWATSLGRAPLRSPKVITWGWRAPQSLFAAARGQRRWDGGLSPPCPQHFIPPFVTPLFLPTPHLHPADGSHQLSEASDEDALQLQQLKEVMSLGEVTMGTRGDKATPAVSPYCDTELGVGWWVPAPSGHVCLPLHPNLVQGGPRRELEHDGLDGTVVPKRPHGGQLGEDDVLIFGWKNSFFGCSGALTPSFTFSPEGAWGCLWLWRKATSWALLTVPTSMGDPGGQGQAW